MRNVQKGTRNGMFGLPYRAIRTISAKDASPSPSLSWRPNSQGDYLGYLEIPKISPRCCGNSIGPGRRMKPLFVPLALPMTLAFTACHISIRAFNASLSCPYSSGCCFNEAILWISPQTAQEHRPSERGMTPTLHPPDGVRMHVCRTSTTSASSHI